MRGDQRIKQILHELKNLKSVVGVRSNGTKQLLVCVRNAEGEAVRERQDIADVFVTFYEELYMTRREQYTDDGWV